MSLCCAEIWGSLLDFSQYAESKIFGQSAKLEADWSEETECFVGEPGFQSFLCDGAGTESGRDRGQCRGFQVVDTVLIVFPVPSSEVGLLKADWDESIDRNSFQGKTHSYSFH